MLTKGIDYGLGRTNIDTATGIRYGCISMHAVSQAWCDSSDAQYGDPHCPECGDSVADTSGHGDEEYEQYGHGCADYVCHSCKHTLDASDVFPEEALGFTYDGDGYQAESCLDSDILITKAPYYTYGPFCSPCVPGAVTLDSGEEYDEVSGVKAYCFGHDWFDDNTAPYRVFRVADDTEVLPKGTDHAESQL